ncbi:methyltransferase domain-containing protein [Streptomyces sp. NPDC005562]|uniref:methyltransferase domain-containing protein n=1 Tax=unclassified Streptomyces TaxID=2593676 RepID=UPI0033AA89AA
MSTAHDIAPAQTTHEPEPRPRPNDGPPASWGAGPHSGVPSADPYADALRTGRGPLFLRRADGWLLPLEVERWCAQADEADLGVVGRCEGAVLDIGCGPGRLVAALAAGGRRALGIDVSEAAVAHTVGLGGQALHRSVFAPLPGEGRWGTALLMDGNLGIGGDPSALLERVAQLLAPDGLLLAETAPVDIDERVDVHLVPADGGTHGGTHGDQGGHTLRGTTATPGSTFPWARLGTPALLRLARQEGWRVDGQWSSGGRPFVALRRPDHDNRTTSRTTSSSAEPPNSAAVISSQRAAKPPPESPVADA